MKITIQDNEGISQAIKRTLIDENIVTANDEKFDKVSIWTQVMSAFHKNETENTIGHNKNTKSISSEWNELKKNVIVYTGDVITIAKATWDKILEIFGVKEQTPDGENPTVVDDNEQGEGSLNVEDGEKVQGLEEEGEERGTESAVEKSQGNPAGDVPQNLSASSVAKLVAKKPPFVQFSVTPEIREKVTVSVDSQPETKTTDNVENNKHDNTIKLPDGSGKISYTVNENGEIYYQSNIRNLQNNDTYKAFMYGFPSIPMSKVTLTFRGKTWECAPETWNNDKLDFSFIATEVVINKLVYDDLRKKQKKNETLTKNEEKFVSQFRETLKKYGLKLDEQERVVNIPKNT